MMTASPADPHVGLVVEGTGGVKALPIVLRAHLHAGTEFRDVLGKPVPPHGRTKAFPPNGIEGYVVTAASRPGCVGVLVVLDAEGDCVAEVGPSLTQRADQVSRVPGPGTRRPGRPRRRGLAVRLGGDVGAGPGAVRRQPAGPPRAEAGVEARLVHQAGVAATSGVPAGHHARTAPLGEPGPLPAPLRRAAGPPAARGVSGHTPRAAGALAPLTSAATPRGRR